MVQQENMSVKSPPTKGYSDLPIAGVSILASVVILILSGGFLSGCYLPFAYPRLSTTGHRKLGNYADEVAVARVDYTTRFTDIGPYYPHGDYTVRMIPKSELASEAITAKRLSMTTGAVIIGIALNYKVVTVRRVQLRFYRPGYMPIAVCEGQEEGRLIWVPALSLAHRERSIDLMIGPPRPYPSRNWPAFRAQEFSDDWRSGLFSSLAGASAESKEACLFAAGEYRRLANSPLCKNEKTQSRLLAKASALELIAIPLRD